ncbi:MAG: YARHG domain-containing protein [Pyrinomonadaceae bacterium]
MEKTAGTNPDKGNNNTATAVQAQPSPAGSPGAESIEGVLGSYVGSFGDNKITLLITKAGAGAVSGRSIVGGNDRPFDGTLSVEDGSYVVEAKEPGDNKYDSVFKFKIAQAGLNEVKGTWKSNDAKRPEKSYTFERKKCEYRDDVGSWPKASHRLLKTANVENLDKRELEFMRNEIFARHGYCFAKRNSANSLRMKIGMCRIPSISKAFSPTLKRKTSPSSNVTKNTLITMAMPTADSSATLIRG